MKNYFRRIFHCPFFHFGVKATIMMLVVGLIVWPLIGPVVLVVAAITGGLYTLIEFIVHLSTWEWEE